MFAEILLGEQYKAVPGNDLPPFLCRADLDDPVQMAIFDKAFWRAKLLSVHYQYHVNISMKQPRRQSPAARLKKRIRNLERRAKKESELFWQDIVAAEIAKKPRYYDLAQIEAEEAELRAVKMPNKNTPAVSIYEVLDWLNANSPMINDEFDKTREMKIRYEERLKMLAAMTPEELDAWHEAQHERMKNDPAWQRAFANEKRSAPAEQEPIPEIDIENFQLLPTY